MVDCGRVLNPMIVKKWYHVGQMIRGPIVVSYRVHIVLYGSSNIRVSIMMHNRVESSLFIMIKVQFSSLNTIDNLNLKDINISLIEVWILKLYSYYYIHNAVLVATVSMVLNFREP